MRSSGRRVVHASGPIQVTGIPSLHLIVQRLSGKPIISQRFTCIALQCSIYVDYTATIQTFSSVHQLHTFMSVDPRVDRATFPPTFWSGGDTLSFVFPYFFGVDIFCTNVHGIRWMIGAIFVKFSQLILLKIVVATRCKAKMQQIQFRLGRSPRPCWGSLQRSLRSPSWT